MKPMECNRPNISLLLFLSQLPHRRVTFSTANQAQDLQDPSQHSYYDSGLEESETPSSKSSSGPRIGPLALPEDHYERTTPDGSIGEMEHPENVQQGASTLLSQLHQISIFPSIKEKWMRAGREEGKPPFRHCKVLPRERGRQRERETKRKRTAT
uniref:Uncharacterized protein n=2 Tax=Hucho hucho TaxID=62062 RepID=A0A4W5RJW7_9TELE